jgi:hypothetical protein
MSWLRRLAHLVPHWGTTTPTTPTTTVPEAAAPEASVHYAPEIDGDPDPGEVVWAWVPYEDDPSRGKDRPVLILATEGDGWLGLPMTSKDHDRDAADEARWGRHWMDVGTGGWDAQRRPSEVRLDRVLRLGRDDVRREGAAIDRRIFDQVLAAVRDLSSRDG